MSVNGIGSNAAATGTDSTSNTSTIGGTSAKSMQDEFLQLLTTQLKNQDPLSPVDQTQMLSQLAQFSSLEQMTNLNSTMSAASQFGGLTQSAGLIDKYVTTYNNSDGSAGPSGKVDAVVMKNNVPYLQIGSDQIAASQVLTVTSTPPDSGQTL